MTEPEHCDAPIWVIVESRVRYSPDGTPSRPYLGRVAVCSDHPHEWAKPLP